jgi:hypothetical protein
MHDNTHVTPDPAYREAVERKRAEDDENLRTAQDSPFLPEARAAFAGLPYFPVDEGWRLAGLVLQPYEGEAPVRFEMAATRGEDRPAVRAGTFRFEARGAEHRLVAYRFLGDDDEPEGLLFVPFMDATTGTDTYGVGLGLGGWVAGRVVGGGGVPHAPRVTPMRRAAAITVWAAARSLRWSMGLPAAAPPRIGVLGGSAAASREPPLPRRPSVS